MRKKVLPFPAPPRQVNAPIVCHHSRVNVRVGTQSYAIDITAQATMLPSEPARPVQHLRVETRYLRLSRPVALSDRIDGWRVCWLGGWDQGKVFFVVMVERVTRAGASRSLANFVGNDAFVPRWSLFYVFRPTFGAGLALLVFFGYRIGAVAGVKGAAPADPFAATFVAGMVGLFADTVMQKLKDLITALLPSQDERKDKISATATAAPSIELAQGTKLNSQMTVKGQNFVSGASVVINGKPRTTAFVSSTELRVTLDASDAIGDVKLVVINPDKRASSEFNGTIL